jgi:D-aminopeptidase
MRADELGLPSGAHPRGSWNAITDVPGIAVGHATVRSDDLNTGVTAIVPEQLGADRRRLPAALFSGNGYGKIVGTTQLDELGEIETPVLLTNTMAVFRVADALATHQLAQPGYEELLTLNPVVGETNDGHLSNIRARSVGEAETLSALRSAVRGPVEEGCVGAGTGTLALGYKGGIGTSSRVVEGRHTIGALVQSNFGGVLTVHGVRCPADELLADDPVEPTGNSCMIVVATDAPLDARQLGRIARRALFAMGRVGASYTHGSGDYAIAFSVAARSEIDDRLIDLYFAATQDAVEEALLNSVLTARTTIGYQGRTVRAVPTAAVAERLRARGVVS